MINRAEKINMFVLGINYLKEEEKKDRKNKTMLFFNQFITSQRRNVNI